MFGLLTVGDNEHAIEVEEYVCTRINIVLYITITISGCVCYYITLYVQRDDKFETLSSKMFSIKNMNPQSYKSQYMTLPESNS